MIADYGFPRSNVAPCLLALGFHGDAVVRHPASCRLLFETYWWCEQQWARVLLARALCPHVDALLADPWGLALLEVALLVSEELREAVLLGLERLALASFAALNHKDFYLVSRLCLSICLSSRAAAAAVQPIIAQLAAHLNGVSRALVDSAQQLPESTAA